MYDEWDDVLALVGEDDNWDIVAADEPCDLQGGIFWSRPLKRADGTVYAIFSLDKSGEVVIINPSCAHKAQGGSLSELRAAWEECLSQARAAGLHLLWCMPTSGGGRAESRWAVYQRAGFCPGKYYDLEYEI